MRVRTAVGVAFLLDTAFLGVYVLVPDLRAQLVDEDRWIENLTVILLLFTCGVAGLRTVHSPTGITWRPALVGGLALVACLDELSFGERVFGLSMPMLGERKLDGVHDLVNLAVDAVRALQFPVWMVLAGLGALVVAALFTYAVRDPRTRSRLDRRIRSIARDPSMTLLGVGVAFAIGAIVLDLHVVSIGGSRLLEELFEMNAALALLVAAWLSAANPLEPTLRSVEETVRPTTS